MTNILLIWVVLSCACGMAEQVVDSWKFGKVEKLNKFHQERADKSTRILYSNWDGKSRERRPAILYFQGSGLDSFLSKSKDGNAVNYFPIDYMNPLLERRYWVFAFEKRGVSTFDGDDIDKATKEAKEHYTLEYRTREAVEVLNYIAGLECVEKKKIAVWGISEGTDVVISAITQSRIPTHAGYFCGGGATQMFDLAILARKCYYRDNPQCEKHVEKYFQTFKEIMDNPDNTEKMFLGLPYKRWASFFRNEPDKLFTKVQIPVFIAHGTADRSIPIESLDYLQAQAVMHGKSNLKFRRYPGLTHGFALSGDEESRESQEMKNKVYGDFFHWLDEQ